MFDGSSSCCGGALAIGRELRMTRPIHGREPASNPMYVATVAILAQGTSRADAVTQAFFVRRSVRHFRPRPVQRKTTLVDASGKWSHAGLNRGPYGY